MGELFSYLGELFEKWEIRLFRVFGFVQKMLKSSQLDTTCTQRLLG